MPPSANLELQKLSIVVDFDLNSYIGLTMLHDDLARLSDLSWLAFSSQLDGDDEMESFYSRQAQNIRHHAESGQDWDATINRFEPSAD